MILHDMIEICEQNNLEDFISWQPHGLAFKIRKSNKFQDIILPIFFRHKNMKSFMRQLYYYGFQRITEGEDTDCYHHKLFVREEKSWAQGIARSTRKGNNKKSTSHTDTNIYPELNGRDHKHDIHKGEISYYVNTATMSDPKTSTGFSLSQNYANGLFVNKDSKKNGDLEYNETTVEQNLNVSLDNGSYNMSKVLTSASPLDIQGQKKEKDTEVDLYSPNLKRTSIFMKTVEDDLQFSLVLQSLRSML